MTGHSTTTELRLRHAELEATAQRLRDRAVGMDPTRATTAATMRRVRSVQLRADEYAALLRLLAGPSLEQVEAKVTAALDGSLSGMGEVQAHIHEPGISTAKALVAFLFEEWRSQA